MNINFETHNNCGIYPGSPIKKEEMHMYFYHYTTLESFMKIWLTQQLLFSESSKMNDILEQNKLLSMHDPSQFELYRDIMLKFKQISLTKDFDSYKKGCMSSVLWGHYANNCTGVCIKLDASKLNLESIIHDDIDYVENFTKPEPLSQDFCDEESIKQFILKHKEIFFFQKLKEWEHENEYRLISDSSNSLNINGAICELFVTKASFRQWGMLRTLVGRDMKISFFAIIQLIIESL